MVEGWSRAALAALVVAVGLTTSDARAARVCTLKVCEEEIVGVCGILPCGERGGCAKQLVRDCRRGSVVCGWCRATGSTPIRDWSPSTPPWAGCGKRAHDTRSTFERVQKRVFDKACTSCHAAGSGAGGLALQGADAYRQLIWTRATSAPDRFRIAPGDASDSYVMRLLEATRKKGSAHPNDTGHPRVPRMSASVKDLVRKWIAAGAPPDGIVAGDRGGPDPMDTPPTIPQPPAPPVGRGIQLKFGPFEVGPKKEFEICRYMELPPVPVSVCSESKNACQSSADCASGEDCVFYIRGAESFSTWPAHHFFLVTYDGADPHKVFPRTQVEGDPFCLNFGPVGGIFAGTDIVRGQTEVERIGYGPEGTAKRLRVGQPLVLDGHFVNSLNVPVQVVLWVNIDFAFPQEVHTLYTGGRLQWNSNIDVPPCERETSCSTWSPATPISMFSFFTHNDAATMSTINFCERVVGKDCAQVGARLYENDDALDPPIMRLTEPLKLAPGQGLQHCCTHLNNPPRLGCTGTHQEKDAPGITAMCHTDADCTGLPGATGRCEPQALKFGFRPGDDACLLIGYYTNQ